MHLQNIESIQKRYDHVYVSPHMDDVALSCGGRILSQIHDGESVLIVTLFGGDVVADLKPRERRFSPFINTRERQSEDERAMNRLGVDFIRLDYPDALYRKRRALAPFRRAVCVSGPEASLCDSLLRDLGKICFATRNKRLYVPLGVGHHLDHLITVHIGTRLRSYEDQDFELCYYEDTPHTLFPNLLKYRMKSLGIDTEILDLSNGNKEKKSIIKETREIYNAIVLLPVMRAKNLVAKVLVYFILLFYVIYMNHLAKPLNEPLRRGGISPDILDISSQISEKLETIKEYRSQLNQLFKDEDSMRSSFARYSKTIGGSEGQFLERCWKVVI